MKAQKNINIFPPAFNFFDCIAMFKTLGISVWKFS